MLLLTDRMNEGRELQRVLSQVRPCELTGLHHPQKRVPDLDLVVCDVSLSTVGALDLLRNALSQLQVKPPTQTLVMLRDPSHLCEAQARMAGATAVLPFRSTIADLIEAAHRLLAQRQATASPKAMSEDLSAGIVAAGSLVTDMLAPHPQPKAVSAATIGHAGEVLLGAIGQTGIQAWLDVVWTYDDTTYQHCLLVAGLAAAFAIELGLPPRSQRIVSQAALVHDIGKAQIPREVLNKTTPLTQAEIALLRSHPARGYAMLAKQGGLDPCVLDAVLHHHEYLDGSGYPERLDGPRISRAVRIITVCDIYAALIERRPYKSALSSGAAYRQLLGLGGRLDPALVGAFKGVIREG